MKLLALALALAATTSCKHHPDPGGMAPAGGVHCSLADWGKFLVVHAGATTTLVSGQTFAHLHTHPDGGRYVAGWQLAKLPNGDAALAHEGSNTRWHAIAVVVPARDEAIAIVANQYDDHLMTAMLPVILPQLR